MGSGNKIIFCSGITTVLLVVYMLWLVAKAFLGGCWGILSDF